MKTLTSNQNQIFSKVDIINFYLQHYQKFLSYALRICNKRSIAEDVMQDVFLSIFTRDNLKVRKPDHFITRAVKFNTLKKIKKNALIQLNYPYDASNRLACKDTNHYDFLAEKIILTEIEKLPRKRRQIFEMKRLQRNSTKDVSMQLNISTKTVENHLTLAVKQLKPKLSYLNSK